jgi:hypothetical protein
MGESGDVWRRQDGLRQKDEHRHETMKAIRTGDTAWALRHIAGPGAAIDHLQATSGAGTTWEPDDTSRGAREPQFPHRSVTTTDELLGNVAATPSAIALRATRIDNDGDLVVEAQSDWVAGPPVVASVLGLIAPPPVGSFSVGAELLAEIGIAAATLRRAAELATDIERLAGG